LEIVGDYLASILEDMVTAIHPRLLVLVGCAQRWKSAKVGRNIPVPSSPCRGEMHEAQTNSDQQAGETSKRRNQALATDNGERDRHGDRSRSRHGQFRYFHEGYYYATPWWTVGVPGVVVGDGGFDCGDGIRVAQRRGFNRVHPVDCAGDFCRYEGWRGGEPWRTRIDAETGQIVSVRPAGQDCLKERVSSGKRPESSHASRRWLLRHYFCISFNASEKN
jgi:hypothetical protein